MEKFDNTRMLIRRSQPVNSTDRLQGFKWLWHGLRDGSVKHRLPAADTITQAYQPILKVNA